MVLSHLLYRSSGRHDRFDRDCDDIVAVARERNALAGLTGFLHAEEGVFVQWLEGPSQAIAPVIDSIMGDTRHRDVTIFSRGGIEMRQFPNWSMGFSNGSRAPLFDFLAERGTNSHDLRAFGLCLHQFLLLRAA